MTRSIVADLIYDKDPSLFLDTLNARQDLNERIICALEGTTVS